MKQGMSIQELAAELARQAEAKLDLVTDTRELSFLTVPQMSADAPGAPEPQPPELSLDLQEFPMTTHAQRQVADRIGYPFRLWERFRENHPDLLMADVNALFRREPERRMVRTLDGRARAFLSDRYRRLDNDQVAEAILPVLGEIPDVSFVSSAVTEKHLYLKAVSPRVQGEVKQGDVVQAGVVIRNSEVGSGSLSVQPMVFRLVCLNGMIAGTATRRYHTGRQVSVSEESYEVFRDETMAADDKALLMKVADLVRAAVDQARFDAILAEMREASVSPAMPDPIKGVERLAKKLDLGEGESRGVLRHLVEGGDLTAWGATNAITRFSQDVESYDRATELEAAGGRLLAMPASGEWRDVCAA